MKKLYIIISLSIINLCFTQNRTAIFNTGSPDQLEHGHAISINQSIANRFTVLNDYVLEAMVFYITSQSSETNLIISIRNDNNGAPGELINDLASWEHTLDPLNIDSYNLITTTDLCLYLHTGNTYWWRIDAADTQTEATWIHSNLSSYVYAASTDNNTWEVLSGNAGAGAIFAEQVYEAPYNLGDVNFDFIINVIDVVSIISHILGNNLLEGDALEYGDLNSDNAIDVVDIVQLVSNILDEQDANPDFVLEDINPASEYYQSNIGPSFFANEVSCYYFGKQG